MAAWKLRGIKLCRPVKRQKVAVEISDRKNERQREMWKWGVPQ